MIVATGMRLTPQRLSVPCGRVSVSMTSQTVVTIPVAYGFTFLAVPRIGVTIASTGAPAIASVKVNGASTTGFNLVVYSVTGASMSMTGVAVDWWAIPA